MKKILKALFTMLGNLMIYKCNEPRRYIINNDKKVIYLENSKVACSSIEASLFSIDTADDNSIHRQLINHYFENINLNEYSEYFCFTFVRNPFERLVSCYESKYHTDKKYLNKSLEHLCYDNYLLGFLRKDKGFKNFIIKIFFLPIWLQNRHFFSQYSLVYGKNQEKKVNYVGKYENLHEEYYMIQKKYGLGKLKKLNASKKELWMDYYDGVTARLVFLKYRKEIKKFGYEKNYQELKKYLINKNIW